MPVFEYRCRSCGAEFERLVLGRPPERVPCPSCGAPETERRWSTFGLGGDARPSAGGSCSGCAASSCSGCGR